VTLERWQRSKHLRRVRTLAAPISSTCMLQSNGRHLPVVSAFLSSTIDGERAVRVDALKLNADLVRQGRVALAVVRSAVRNNLKQREEGSVENRTESKDMPYRCDECALVRVTCSFLENTWIVVGLHDRPCSGTTATNDGETVYLRFFEPENGVFKIFSQKIS